jgi:hypothetical protein
MSPEHSPAEASLRTGIRTGRNDDVVVDAEAELDHRMQDLLESEASAGARKWPVWKSLTLIAFAGIGLWALIFTAYRAIF